MGSVFGGGNPDIVCSVGIEGVDTTKQGLDEAKGAVEGFSTSAKVALGALAIASNAVFADILFAAGEFDKSMGQIKLDFAPDSQAYKDIETSIFNLAQTSPININQIAAGVDQIADRGVPAADAANAMTAALNLSEATGLPLSEAIDLLTGSMKAYGDLDWSNINTYSDVFFTMIANGVDDLPGLATAFSKLLPDAAALGIDFREIAGAAISFTGTLGTAPQVFNSVYQIMDLLLKPTEGVADAFEAMGVATGQELITKMGGLSGALQAIKRYADEHNVSIGELLGRKTLMNDYFTMTGDLSVQWATDTQGLFENVKSTADGAATMNANLVDQLAIFKQNIQVGFIQFANETFYPIIKDLLTTMNNSPEAIGVFATSVAIFAAGVTVIAGAATGIHAVKIAFDAIMALSWGPVGIAITAIAAAIGGIVALGEAQHADKIKELTGAITGDANQAIRISELAATYEELRLKFVATGTGASDFATAENNLKTALENSKLPVEEFKGSLGLLALQEAENLKSDLKDKYEKTKTAVENADKAWAPFGISMNDINGKTQLLNDQLVAEKDAYDKASAAVDAAKLSIDATKASIDTSTPSVKTNKEAVLALNDQFKPLGEIYCPEVDLGFTNIYAGGKSLGPVFEEVARTTDDANRQFQFGSTYIEEFIKSISKEDIASAVEHFGELNNMLADTGVVSGETAEKIDQGLNLAMMALTAGTSPVSLAITGVGLVMKLFAHEEAPKVVRSVEEVTASLGDLGVALQETEDFFEQYSFITSNYIEELRDKVAYYQEVLRTATGGNISWYEEQLRNANLVLEQMAGVFGNYEMFTSLQDQAESFFDYIDQARVAMGSGTLDLGPLYTVFQDMMAQAMQTLSGSEVGSNAYNSALAIIQRIIQEMPEMFQANEFGIEIDGYFSTMEMYLNSLGIDLTNYQQILADALGYVPPEGIADQIEAQQGAVDGLAGALSSLAEQRQRALDPLLQDEENILAQIADREAQLAELEAQRVDLLGQARDLRHEYNALMNVSGDLENIQSLWDALPQMQQYGYQMQDLHNLMAGSTAGVDITNFYELGQLLEQITGQAQRLTIVWGDMVGNMTAENEGLMGDLEAASSAVEQMQYYDIDLDTTQADEQINAFIFRFRDYMETLSPDSQAFADAQAAFQQLVNDFIAAGGVINEEDALQFNIDTFNDAAGAADTMRNDILAQIADINSQRVELNIDIDLFNAQLESVRSNIQAVIDAFDNQEITLNLNLDNAQNQLQTLLDAYRAATGQDYDAGEMHTGGMITAHEGLLSPNETLIKALKSEYVLQPGIAGKFGETKLDAFNLTGDPNYLRTEDRGQSMPVINIHRAAPDTYVTIDSRVINSIYPQIKNLDFNTTEKVHFQ